MPLTRLITQASPWKAIALAVQCAAATAIGAQAGPPIAAEFDRFRNVTTITMAEVQLSNDTQLEAFYVFAGRSQRAPQPKLALHFSRSGDDWEYLSFHDAVFLLDGRTRVDAGGGDHRGYVGSGYVLEQIFWDLTRAQAAQIARAKKVEMRVGVNEFTWSDSLQRGFRQLFAFMAASKTPIATVPTIARDTQPRPSTVATAADSGSPSLRTEGIAFPYPGYLANVQRQIALRFDPADRTPSLRAELTFLLHRDGSVSNLRFLKRSGVYALDLEAQAAIEAASAAQAFGPLPAGFTDDVLPVVFATDAAVTPTPAGDTYFEFQVEKTALSVPGNPQPQYPSMLQSAGVEGKVLAQFVVDPTGTVDTNSFKVLESSHELFSKAVRDVLPRMRFYPAERAGVKVRQMVQQVFVFGLNK